ncbi:hypothetical protein [Dethiothermospora halolimnae]|uniref:hypothetical protein n=1 Tax=Dethiothermospora halolimnae TaxID=3114390 RepID=UPI003CCBCB73
MGRKIKVIGNSIGNIEKAIINHLKSKEMTNKYDAFRKLMGVYREDIVPEDEHNVVVHFHSGSNEGYYVCLGTVKGDRITNYFIFRFHIKLEEVIKFQNELLTILEI